VLLVSRRDRDAHPSRLLLPRNSRSGIAALPRVVTRGAPHGSSGLPARLQRLRAQAWLRPWCVRARSFIVTLSRHQDFVCDVIPLSILIARGGLLWARVFAEGLFNIPFSWKGI